MQKAVMAARAANLDVDDDTAIPTLHWPPDPPTSNTTSSTSGTTSAAPITTGATVAETAPTVTGIVKFVSGMVPALAGFFNRLWLKLSFYLQFQLVIPMKTSRRKL